MEMLRPSLNEVQNERSCLENKLQEQRAKRRSLEPELDKTKAKLAQVKDTYFKKTEISKVLNHKVGQFQISANSIEEENQTRRRTIAEKNDQISSEEKESQLEEIKAFEENLAAIADKLVLARKFYDDGNLSQEISDIEERKEQMESKAADFYKEMVALESNFEKIQLNRQEKGEDLGDSGIDMDTRKTIKSLLQEVKEECERATALLQNVDEALKDDQEMLEKVKE
ncbi:uncharacterized protein PF3D7_1120000-like [Argopecten irradians]|uniref:uncharacterized protein PF3D7_1120000-like n=1 Tax=Argopecten irradians TaxID=31199 RepID=UPI00371AA577